MEQIYDVAKSFVDPIAIIFILLFIAFIACLVSGKKKGGPLFLLFLLIVLYGASIQPVSSYLSFQLEELYLPLGPAQEHEKLDVIVVLSGGSYTIPGFNAAFSGEASLARLAHAVRMFKERQAKYLVCSGASGKDATDAELMARMAIDFGVPKESIRIEGKSQNTYEHAIEFNRLFVDKSLKIGLVTAGFHMRRSESEFSKYFSSVYPLPSGYLYAAPDGPAVLRFIPNSLWLFNNGLILREYVGKIWYGIRDI